MLRSRISYEGTGRSLSLKLVQQLRQQASNARPASGSGKREASDSAGVRKQSAADTGAGAGGGGEGLVGASASAGGRRLLYELRLEESIRYSPGDAVELWLNELLLLDCCDIAEAARALTPVANAGAAAGALGALGVARAGCPPLERCRLYYVNRDTLFSFHRLSELFLKQIFAIYVSSHYKVRSHLVHSLPN